MNPHVQVISPGVLHALGHASAPSEAVRREHVARLDVGSLQPRDLHALVMRAANAMGAGAASIAVVEGLEHRVLASVGCAATPSSRVTSFCTHVVAIGAPVNVADLTATAFFAHHPRTRGEGAVRAYVGVPVRDDDDVIVAVLSVQHHEPFMLSARQVGELEEMAAVAARVLVPFSGPLPEPVALPAYNEHVPA